MNKKFYLALAATAALFASCSSDDVIGNARQNALDENAPAKIEIGIAPTVDVSRGTGRVGDVAGAANAQWAGQKFSVLMLEKGTMLGAYEDLARQTPIFKGAEMTADGVTVIALDNDAVYYPTATATPNAAAVYDFWGYRLDNSETPTAGTPVFNGYDDATATQITVPFEINGTQDIMVATTTPSDAAYADANPANIYSAKSARNGVVPNLSFKHLLTSLTFKVKAKSRDITTAANNPTTDPNWQAGYQITNITLQSMSTGELIVAYTGDEPANRIIWDDTKSWANPDGLATFQLQCRKKEVRDAADIKMVKVRSDAVLGNTIDYTAGYKDKQGNSSYTVGADLLTMDVYDSEDLDNAADGTGLPIGHKTTLGEMQANPGDVVTGYILTYNATDRTTGEPKKYKCDYTDTPLDRTNDLVPFVDNVDAYPVVLRWKVVADDASAIVADEAAYDALDPSEKAGKGDDSDLANAKIAENIDKYFFVTGDKAYKFVAGTEAEPDVVGEPMLVAPSNDDENSGYQVKVTYKYWKKQTSSQAVEVEKTTEPITVRNYVPDGGARVYGEFLAGKNYNVTITLYSDGEFLNGEATSEPWDEGGDLDAGEQD